jgi:HipA-like protein
MRRAKIFFREEEAGILIQEDNGIFVFRYLDSWVSDNRKPAISLTLPKSQQEFHSEYLFPFFFNMLPEGANKQAVCRQKRIDENDHFGLLMTTAGQDTIGAVRVIKIPQSL